MLFVSQMLYLQTRTLVASLGTLHYVYNTLSNIMICTKIYKAKYSICVLSYSVRLTNYVFTDKDTNSVSRHATVGTTIIDINARIMDHIMYKNMSVIMYDALRVKLFCMIRKCFDYFFVFICDYEACRSVQRDVSLMRQPLSQSFTESIISVLKGLLDQPVLCRVLCLTTRFRFMAGQEFFRICDHFSVLSNG
jgi:hypothetical protein